MSALALADRLAALREALDAAEDAPGVAAEDVRALLAKAGARMALGDSTVVALAGATGSGKSTLFNALAGQELSSPGVRRPTTGTAHACVWSTDPAAATGLLDWLGVGRRHLQAGFEPTLDGLVLLDLPDHDSTRLENRLEVDRLVNLVDLLVWVLDPQKYADAAVHDRYLAPYAGHAGVLFVVLNQVDALTPPDRDACLADLRGLLDREGLPTVPLLAVSARTGLGVSALRAELADRVAVRRAAAERLTGDIRLVAGRAAQGCQPAPAPADGRGAAGRRSGRPAAGGPAGTTFSTVATVATRDRALLVDALAGAAGVPVVVAAVDRAVRIRGTATTGWPLLRVVRRLRPDPLRRLHLSAGRAATGMGANSGTAGVEGVGGVGGRTSLPPPAPVQEAALTQALRGIREASSAGLPEPWRDGLRETVTQRSATLPARLDRAVAGTDLGAEVRPRWWSVVAAVQWLLLVVALAGAAWLLVLAGLGALQLARALPLPTVAGLPVPTLLLVAGLLAGVLLTLVVRPLVLATARRRAASAEGQLRARIAEVADSEILTPLAARRGAYDRWCAALARAAS